VLRPKIREAEVALKQRSETEEVIEKLNQKQLEIKKLKTEKESLMNAVTQIEDVVLCTKLETYNS
jgi:hypothetical protein